MPQLLFIILALIVVYYGMKLFANANPAKLAKLFKRIGGGASIVVGGLLLLRGRIDIALVFGGLGAWLLGWSAGPDWRSFFTSKSPSSSASASRVRTAMIEMELDHDSGSMNGTVLGGPVSGRKLNELTRPQCEELYGQCVRDDPEGARLLEAYLDRRFPGWRLTSNGDADAGQANQSGRGIGRGPMTENEAYEVLGLGKGATMADITTAHRSLMKKLHPDHGGSTSLAARVNEAKDVLVRRHH